MNRMRNFFGGGNGLGGNGNGGGGFNMPGPLGNAMNVLGKFKEFMANPLGAIMNSGLNIPQNIQNNPEAITNYLRSSGRMTDDQYNQCSQMASWAQNLFGNGK